MKTSAPVFIAAEEVQRALRDMDQAYCVIGALAVQRWGEPRATRDVDLTLAVEFGEEEGAIEGLLDRFEGRGDDPFGFALRNRTLLLRSRSGVAIDVGLGGLPYEHDMVARSTECVVVGDHKLRTCSAEDLIVLKAFAGRPKDWMDIDGVFLRQGPAKLDRKLIFDSLAPLLEVKVDSDALPRLEEFFARG